MLPDTASQPRSDTLTGAVNGSPGASPPPSLPRAILQTLAYADVFDYPLTEAEVHRYLVGVKVDQEAVAEALDDQVRRGAIVARDGYFALRGREATVARRQRRAQVAAALWPDAVRYGRAIASLPFVKMVTVTGALAADNVDPDADIDFLIVTEAERLWLCRLAVVALVRLAYGHGRLICPNYFLSERALVLQERNLFAARELAQMVPLAGADTYQVMRELNDWTLAYLPNAVGAPSRSVTPAPPALGRLRHTAETILRTPPAGWLDRWEMNRKIRKFRRRADYNAEVDLSPDWCKGHFDGHGQRIMMAYQERLKALVEL